MVTIWRQVLLFPQASVASQVLLIVYSCGQAPPVVTSLKSTAGAGSQLSEAVAEPVLAGSVLSSHSTVMLAGQRVITGGVLSSTVMVWAQVLLLPHASVAIQVRVMIDSCGQPPGTTDCANVTSTGTVKLMITDPLPAFTPFAIKGATTPPV